MPKLIDCTARTLTFDDGSTLTIPPFFSDNTKADVPWLSVWVRSRHGAAVILEGL